MKESFNSGIAPLKSQSALMELINYSYFSNKFRDKDKVLNLFQCSSVLRQTTVRSLKINKSLEKLPEVVKIIEKDVYHEP